MHYSIAENVLSQNAEVVEIESAKYSTSAPYSDLQRKKK